MTNSEYKDLLEELQAIYTEAKVFTWKTSPEQSDLMGRLDRFFDKLSPVHLCANLTAEHFKGQMLGSKRERAILVMDVTSALSSYAFACLSKEVDR